MSDHHAITTERLTVFFEKFRQALTPHFFLSFNDKRQITGQLCSGFEVGFHRLQVRKMLALVVAATTGIQKSPGNPGLKRRRLPEFERVRGLHVVMTIDQIMRSSGSRPAQPGEHDGMSRGGTQSRLQTDSRAMSYQPLRAADQVWSMRGLRRHTRKPEILTQIRDETRLMLTQIIEHLLHEEGFKQNPLRQGIGKATIN